MWRFHKTLVAVAEEDLQVAVIAIEVAVKAVETLNLEEAIAPLNLVGEEDLISLLSLETIVNLLKGLAEEDLQILEVLVNPREEVEAEKRTLSAQ